MKLATITLAGATDVEDAAAAAREAAFGAWAKTPAADRGRICAASPTCCVRRSRS